jgi:fluoride exporter
MGYLLVGIGGLLGSITRFSLGKYISEHSKTVFPRGTFIINITGALLLGIVVAFQNYNNIYLLLGDGFLGAYTTFSTFMYEGFNLFQADEKLDAFKYIFGSLLLGILGFVLGAKIGNLIKLL